MRLVKEVGTDWKAHAALFRSHPTGNGKSVEISKSGNNLVRFMSVRLLWHHLEMMPQTQRQWL